MMNIMQEVVLGLNVTETCFSLFLRIINPREATEYDGIPVEIIRIGYQEPYLTNEQFNQRC